MSSKSNRRGKSSRLILRLDDELHARVKRSAEKLNVSESELVRNLLAVHIAPTSAETPFEKLVRLKILGAAEGMPSDLSTNPKYMEGFGK